MSLIATVFLLALTVRADKKIELQDIEEDNLRSEQQKEYEKSDTVSQTSGPGSGQGSGPGLVSLDFLKNSLLSYYQNPTSSPQRTYIPQYAVTEPPERPPVTKHAPQQAMVGYLSNVPMQIYLVPQYYNDQANQHTPAQPQYQPAARVAAYQTAPEPVQTNYVQVPAYNQPVYVTGPIGYSTQASGPGGYSAQPSGHGGYSAQATGPVGYSAQATGPVGYSAQPTISTPVATVAPVVTYQVPVIQYSPVQPTTAPKQTYYQNPQSIETNSVDDVHEHVTADEFPRHYHSRVPIRENYRPIHPNVHELPYPSPALINAPPPHLTHIPKTLPQFRPYKKPLYQSGGPYPAAVSGVTEPYELYRQAPTNKRRPSSLLDSYIPSTVQVEYLKRGLIKEPLAVYDALTSGRLPHPIPRNYERGFLPNQMYHTAAGGVTFGRHYRTPKSDKIPVRPHK